jgi:hypothetical protein
MAALTQKNGFQNELISSIKERFKEYIKSDRFTFTVDEKKNYIAELDKDLNRGNVNEFNKFPNNLIKQHIDGKISII